MTIEKSPFDIGLIVLRVVCSSATVEAKNIAKPACKSNKSRGVTLLQLLPERSRASASRKGENASQEKICDF